MTDYPDQSLLRLWCSERDARAFKELAKRHSQMVFATCRRILRDGDAAADVTQECFLALSQHAADPPRSLPAWLHVMAVRRSLNVLRAAGRRHERETRFVESQRVADDSQTWDTLMADVDEAIASLPEDLRGPLILHFLEEKSQQAIARELGISQTTVSRRIDEGIDAVRASLRNAAPALTLATLAQCLHAEASVAVPTAVSSSLGKLALAIPSTTPITTSLTIGGALLVKKAIAITVGILVVAGAAMYLRPSVDQESTTPTANPAAKQTLPLAAPSDDATPAEPAPVEEPTTSITPPPAVSSSKSSTEGAVTGRVFDADTKTPITGVEVNVEVLSELSRRDAKKSATTDSEGRYRISGLSVAENIHYSLSCDSPQGYRRLGYNDRPTFNFTTATVIDSMDLALEKEVVLSGVVVDTQNKPVPDADVFLSGGSDIYIADKVKSSSEGTFTFHQLPPTGDLFALARLEGGWVSEPVAITLTEAGITDLVLVLQEAATVSGVIVDTEDKPLSGYRASAERKPTDRMGSGEGGESDGEGRFEVTGLPSGAYELIVMSNQMASMGAEQKGVAVELTPGQHLTDVKLVYERDLTISGIVLNSSRTPIAGATITAGSPQFGGGTQSTTDADGRFTITDLQEGTYSVDADAEGYQYTQTYGVSAGTDNVEIVLPEPYKISGRVLDSVTGKPIPDFEIMLTPNWENELDSFGARNFSKHSDPNGHFELTQPQSFRSVLAARAPGYATAMTFLDLMGPPYAREVDLRLDRGDALEGIVVNSAGAPVAMASIYLGPVVTYGDRSITKSADDGTFTLPSFPRTTQRVSAYLPGYAIGSVSVLADTDRTQPVRIVLGDGGTIQGTVTFAEGVTPTPSSVGVSYEVMHTLQDGEVPLGPEGIYAIDHVMAGEATIYARVNLEANFPDQITLKQTVQVAERGVTTVDFVVQPGACTIEGTVQFPEGAHRSNATIVVSIETPNGIVSKIQVIEYAGAFHLEGFPSGSGTVKIDAYFNDHARIVKEVPVDLKDGETTVLDIAL